MGVSSKTRFYLGYKSYADINVITKIGHIVISKKDIKDLSCYIHEINEIETSVILEKIKKGCGNKMINVKKKYFKLLESRKRLRLNTKQSYVSHLISPYGFNCLIGCRENLLEW